MPGDAVRAPVSMLSDFAALGLPLFTLVHSAQVLARRQVGGSCESGMEKVPHELID